MRKRFRLALGTDWLVPILILLYAAAFYWSTRSIPKPEINAIIIEPLFFLTLIFVVYYLATQLRAISRTEAEPTSAGIATWLRQADNRKLLALLAGIAVYILLMEVLGFTLSTVLYMIVTMRYLGVRNWPAILAITAVTVGSLYWVFNVWLYIELPVGILDL